LKTKYPNSPIFLLLTRINRERVKTMTLFHWSSNEGIFVDALRKIACDGISIKIEIDDISNKIKTVRLLENPESGKGMFDIGWFTPNKNYEVYGVTLKSYRVGISELCYILKDNAGKLMLKSTSNFEVVE